MMEIEHLITLGVVVVFSLLAAWLVWTCMCKHKDEDEEDDVESHMDEDMKSVNSRTRVIPTKEPDDSHHYLGKELGNNNPPAMPSNATAFIKPKKGSSKKASSYVQTGRDNRFHDPFGEWQPREKMIDDTEALSGIKSYRKSPVLPHRS